MPPLHFSLETTSCLHIIFRPCYCCNSFTIGNLYKFLPFNSPATWCATGVHYCKAIEVLSDLAPIDIGLPGWSFLGFFLFYSWSSAFLDIVTNGTVKAGVFISFSLRHPRQIFCFFAVTPRARSCCNYRMINAPFLLHFANLTEEGLKSSRRKGKYSRALGRVVIVRWSVLPPTSTRMVSRHVPLIHIIQYQLPELRHFSLWKTSHLTHLFL